MSNRYPPIKRRSHGRHNHNPSGGSIFLTIFVLLAVVGLIRLVMGGATGMQSFHSFRLY